MVTLWPRKKPGISSIMGSHPGLFPTNIYISIFKASLSFHLSLLASIQKEEAKRIYCFQIYAKIKQNARAERDEIIKYVLELPISKKAKKCHGEKQTGYPDFI